MKPKKMFLGGLLGRKKKDDDKPMTMTQRKAEEAQKLVEKQKRAEAALTVAVIILSATALFGGMYLFAIYTGWITW